MLSTTKTEFKPEENGYKFIRLPKNASLLLNGNERSLFGVMVDYQQMIDQQNNNKGNDFPMAISYICRNLDISDKTAQSSINKLIELDLINKHSGYRTRTKNVYSINFDKIRELDAMKSDQLFELREKLRKARSPKSEEPVVLVELPEVQHPTEDPKQELQPKYSTDVFEQIKSIRDGLLSIESDYCEEDREVEEEYEEEQAQESVDGTEEYLFSRFENYFDTNNNGLLLGLDDCIENMTNNFTHDEIQYVMSKRKIFITNCKLNNNQKRALEYKLALYIMPEVKEQQIDNLNF